MNGKELKNGNPSPLCNILVTKMASFWKGSQLASRLFNLFKKGSVGIGLFDYPMNLYRSRLSRKTKTAGITTDFWRDDDFLCSWKEMWLLKIAARALPILKPWWVFSRSEQRYIWKSVAGFSHCLLRKKGHHAQLYCLYPPSDRHCVVLP